MDQLSESRRQRKHSSTWEAHGHSSSVAGGREVMEFGEWVGSGRREVGEVESFWGKACGGWCGVFFLGGGLRR